MSSKMSRVDSVIDSITAKAFRDHVHDLLSTWHVPGFSIAVFDDKRIVSRGFGHSDIDNEVPATGDTIYDCASTSKSLTAASLGKLVSEGHFKWTTPVSNLLEEDFVLPDATSTAGITVEDILSHRSGMARHDWSFNGAKAKQPDTARSITRNLRNLPMGSPIRSRFHYNNMVFTVGSYLVEQLSKQSFAEYLQTHFWDVLGMKSTYLQPSSVLQAGQEHRFAKGYIWNEDSQKYNEVERVDQPEGQGAGLIQSTAADYAKWAQALMTKNESVLPETIYKDMFMPRIIEDVEQEGALPFTSNTLYALGLEVEHYRGHRMISHGGSETGFRILITFLPDYNFGVMVYGNSQNAGPLNTIVTMGLLDEALGVDPTHRIDWKSWVKEDFDKHNDMDEYKELWSELLGPDSKITEPSAPSISLSSFVGRYNNKGYHDMTIEIKDDGLFIDAGDRGMPFEVTFEHLRDDTLFIATLMDPENDKFYVRAQFELDEEKHAIRMGLGLCDEISPECIWFDRV